MSINYNIMSFDFGTKNIGIAVGQNITYTAQPLTVLKSKNGAPNWKMIKNIFEIWQPYIIIVGLPINMNGHEQKITTKTRIFAQYLINIFNIQVILHDERLSTFEARYNLSMQYKLHQAKKYHQIDAESAAIILESWFNKIKN